MKHILNKNHIFPLLLILIASIICFLNYTPGTILSGWDTLHPEFNFPLNLQRAFFGVFRFEQGLGAVAGHSHMADLPRILLLFLSSFVLPTNFLRYFYMFLMLIIGPLGMYYFLLKVVIKDKTSSFLGALFYLLNIGTVQIFFVPFEMFATQYGFLPWLILFTTQYLKSKEKKYLLLFSITTLLSTPIAYAATLWYMQFAFLFFYILVFTILNPTAKKRAFYLILTTLAINSFWILPNIYFLINYGSAVMQANINKLFSPQAFLYNKEFGDLKDILFMKTFLFDWNIYAGNGNFIQLLSNWDSHLSNLSFLGIGFGIAAISGLILGTIRKNKALLSLLPGLIICIFFLINDNFPTGFIYTFLQKTFPIFKEAFRFPDDKILGLFVFCFSVFFAFGIYSFKKILPKIISPILAVLITILLFYFMMPIFQGNLISPSMRIKIPTEYFSMFNWLNKQEDTGRIANLPINSFWGWEYYNWYNDKQPSFQGAGFLWFGIKQPLLARDFDRWSTYNEQYYQEMSYAIYSQNPTLLTSVIKKYDIHYVLIDKNIIAPQNNPNVLFYNQTDSLLSSLVKNGILQKPISFGKISIYQIKANNENKQFTSLSLNTTNLFEDFTFEKYGNYLENQNTKVLSLTDNSSILKNNLFKVNSLGILLKKPTQNINLSSYLDSENNISTEVVAQKEVNGKLSISFYPETFIQNKKAVPIVAEINLQNRNLTSTTLSVNQKDNFTLKNLNGNNPLSLGRVILNTKDTNTISLYDDKDSSTITPDFSKLDYSLQPCDILQNENPFGIDVTKNGNGFTIFGKNASLCMIIPVSQISKSSGENISKDSLLGISFSYNGDKNPDICALNLLTGGCIKNITNETIKIGYADINSLGIRITLNALNNTPAPSTPFGTILEKSEKQQKASYQNIIFTVVKPFYSAGLSSDILNKSLSEAYQTQNNTETLFIPAINNDEFSKNIIDETASNNSCRGLTKDVEKKIKSDTNGQYIEYISKEGSFCDYFSYQNLAQNTSYAIVLTAKNVKGLPLNICVSNPNSTRCDIYSNLPTITNKTQTVFILPAMSKDKTGFSININNFAINKTESINDLYGIQVIPFPYAWLTNMSTGSNLANKEVLKLPYSFENGWKAYEIKDVNFITETFPFLFGKEIKTHVKINGWENGWTIDNTSNNNQIVIVYLPQYLEYFGFILLIFIPLGFAMKRKLW